MAKYTTQPEALVSVNQAKEAVLLWESGDVSEFREWCVENGRMISEALRAWAALEFVMAKTSIEGLTWWSSPGCYGLKTLDTPDCVTSDDDEQWQCQTLCEVIREAAADFATDDDGDGQGGAE